MKRPFGTIVAIAAGLMVLVGIVGVVRQSGLFVTPPEAVAESFVRQLVTGHYDRALRHLDPTANAELDEDDLRHFALFIMMRSGEVIDVRGEPRWVRGGRAEASAMLTTSVSGEWALNLRMVRNGGGWSIAEIGSIEHSNSTESIFGTKIPTAIAMRSAPATAAADG